MKTLQRILMFFFVISICVVQAQGKTKGKIVYPGPKMPRLILSAGYGNTIPSSSTKDAYFTNSSGISGDLFVPFLLFRKGWDGTVKGGNYGFNIGGSYNFGGNGNPSPTLPAAFPVTGQTSSSVAYRGVDPKNPGFRIGGGPQVNFYLMNHLLLSPMVLAEYFSTTQKTLSAVQTTQVKGQSTDYNLLTLPETKTTGFSVTPKLRMSYFFGDNFGIFADAGYIFGPKVNTQMTSLKPEGNSNQAGQYNQQQLDFGTQVKNALSTSYSAFAVNIGLSFAFGGKKVGVKSVQSQGQTFGQKVASGVASGITVVSQGTKKTDGKGWNGVAKTDDKGWNGKTEVKDKDWNGVAKKDGNGASDAGYHVQEFNNGCTRTCTGDWSSLSGGGYSCDGTAGPLNCNGMGNTLLRENNNQNNQNFDSDGNIKPKMTKADSGKKQDKVARKGWDGTVKGGSKRIKDNDMPKYATEITAGSHKHWEDYAFSCRPGGGFECIVPFVKGSSSKLEIDQSKGFGWAIENEEGNSMIIFNLTENNLSPATYKSLVKDKTMEVVDNTFIPKDFVKKMFLDAGIKDIPTEVKIPPGIYNVDVNGNPQPDNFKVKITITITKDPFIIKIRIEVY
ncbi:hypothetical protein [Halpernia frigidisoli]|uniref:Uncharacterized protein n=1 Tax=Halpernia frigidisoli TaxID=1125876 RepID=A0A1I3E5P6_9FLAO|nr:hypothetical protein [Halpernia frigidisoli]SFH94294.1 hypothetical protein SAMN05443292_0891 [Halpernia frigidisoli]